MVDKETLTQYGDLLKEVEELHRRIAKIERSIEKTEKDVERIERDGDVVDTVSGGRGGVQHYRIEGFPYPEYSRKKTLLCTRRNTLVLLEAELLEKINQIESFLSNIQDSKMRRIIELRCVENLSWNEVADKIGGNSTEDSVRKMFCRFTEKSL